MSSALLPRLLPRLLPTLLPTLLPPRLCRVLHGDASSSASPVTECLRLGVCTLPPPVPSSSDPPDPSASTRLVLLARLASHVCPRPSREFAVSAKPARRSQSEVVG